MAPIRPRISVEYTDMATVVSFTDERILEDADIQAIDESLMSVIEQAEGINLILNFENVKFLSSAVLGLLIKISKKIYERGGQLKLCGIAPRIYEIFKITRLTKVFEIYPDVESADASINSES